MRMICACILLLIGVSLVNGDYLRDFRGGGELYARRRTTCPCGQANKQGTRIVGGKEAVSNDYPFMLALYKKGYFFCGASILTERHALTAAHCTRDPERATITAVAGLHSIHHKSPQAQEVRVASFVAHERYVQTDDVLVYDISILFLASPLKFNRYVSPVCMPSGALDITNKMVKYIGWGRVHENSDSSPILKEVDQRVLPNDVCEREAVMSPYGPGFRAQKRPLSIFCSHSKEGMPCNGDSGGPIVYLDPETQRLTQVGLVSLVECKGALPTMTTDVRQFVDWIRNKIGQPLCTKA